MADDYDYVDEGSGGEWFSNDPVVMDPVTADPNDTTLPTGDEAVDTGTGGDFSFYDDFGNLIPDTNGNTPDSPGFWNEIFGTVGNVLRGVAGVVGSVKVGAGGSSGGAGGSSGGGTNTTTTSTKVIKSTPNPSSLLLAAGAGALAYHLLKRK